MRRVINAVLTAAMASALFCVPAMAAEATKDNIVPAMAEESSPHSISGMAAFGTDYYWRGYSSTGGEAAVQGEIDYEHTSGFYAGIWGSNVDYGAEYVDDFDEWTYAEETSNLELDFWVGYWTELGDFELDLMAIYYFYPGNADAGLLADPEVDDWVKGEAEADMFELHIGLAYRFDMPTTPKLSIGYDITPNYSNEDGLGHHINALLDMGLPADIALQLEAGYQTVEGDKTTGCDSTGYCYGQDGDSGFDYAYYRIGINRDIFFDGLNFDLSYWYNGESDWFQSIYDELRDEYGYGTKAENKFILTASYSF
jgi:uncharacterized protein (TIGR02001 family)